MRINLINIVEKDKYKSLKMNCTLFLKICIVHVYEKTAKTIPIIDKHGQNVVYLLQQPGENPAKN